MNIGAGSVAGFATEADAHADPSFFLNDARVSLHEIDPHRTLLEIVRSRGLTGTKEGCAEGDCGACTVVVCDRMSSGDIAFRAINACLALAAQLPNAEVWTIEAVAGPTLDQATTRPPNYLAGEVVTLHPVQAAVASSGGSQCGYCTPGFVMTMVASYYSPIPSEVDSIDPGGEILAGNLCRCTGYRALRAVAKRTAGAGSGEVGGPHPFGGARSLVRLAQETHAIGSNQTTALPTSPSNRAFRPSTLRDAFALRAANPEYVWLAGGTDIGVDVTRAFRRFPGFIALDRVAELQGITVSDRSITIGAGVTLTELELWDGLDALPSVRVALGWFASRQIRNRATIGGNLMTASPIGDLSPVWLALDAEAIVASPTGTRHVPLAEFFTGYRQTAVGRDELLQAISVPIRTAGRRVSLVPDQRTSAAQAAPYLDHISWVHKVARRRRVDISTVLGAFSIDIASDGTVTDARIAFGGVAASPMRAHAVENALRGCTWTSDGVVAARTLLATTFTPLTDHRGSATYRQQLIMGLLDRCLAETQNVPNPNRWATKA